MEEQSTQHCKAGNKINQFEESEMKDWKDNSYHKKNKEDTSKTNTVNIKIPRYIILL